MYSNGGEPHERDVVRRINGGDAGVVEKVIEGGSGGEEAVLVRWTTVHEHPPSSGMNKPYAPSTAPTRLLELVSRG
jgi:hypothetical protein